MPNRTFFATDYASARHRFRTEAAACGAERHVETIAAKGPDGLELTIDLARLPGADPARLVVISSGLHGIEGFFGSAVQSAWLASQHDRGEPLRCSVLLIHALNPFGFAWRRRVNENNVDLNRNFLLPEDSYQGAPATLRQINGFINPVTPPPPVSFFLLPAIVCIARYGFSALKSALTTGQYEFPKGLFYGGTAPEESTRLVQSSFRDWISPARHVVHLDFHTGLGRFGTHQLLTVAPPSSETSEWLCATFGANRVVPFPEAESDRHTWRGSMGLWLTRALSDTGVDYQFALPEFGTYAGIQVFQALHEENRIAGRPDHRRYESLKRKLADAFVPRSPVWRERTLADAVALIETAADAVAAR